MLYTAQYRYAGIDRYDITSKRAGIFSPTWSMVSNYKDTGDTEVYTSIYLEMMRESYRNHSGLWQEMVDMSTRADITLVCYCRSGEFCHRVLLAEMLQKCGANYKGER
jgi:uncharacterized protein YeaO (DUF488 family)